MMITRKKLTAFALVTGLGLAASAASPDAAVAKFRDGKKAAVSLTFDDAHPSHLSLAIPTLNKYGLRGTFYIVAGRLSDDQWRQWKAVGEMGHELGNHSLTHFRPMANGDFTDSDIVEEVEKPLTLFKEKIGAAPTTFCFPGGYGLGQERFMKVVRRSHAAFRYKQTCYGGNAFTVADSRRLVDEAIQDGEWLVPMFHAVSPAINSWMPLADDKTLDAILADMKSRENDLWIAPFAEVAAYETSRENARLRVVARAPALLAFRLEPVGPRRERVPLTVALSGFPRQPEVSRGGKPLPVKTIGGKYFAELIPDEQEIRAELPDKSAVAYAGPGFNLRVTPRGTLQDIRAGDETLINKVFFFGTYLLPPGAAKVDTRFFQENGEFQANIARPSPDAMEIHLDNAVLGNGESAKAVKYSQRIMISPFKITVDAEAETLVPMASNSWIFNSLIELSLNFAGRGFRYATESGQDALRVVQDEFGKNSQTRFPESTVLSFSGRGGVLSFTAGPRTAISGNDARAWSGEHLDIRIGPKTQWQNHPVSFPIGTRFKWSYAIAYRPHDK